MKVHKICSQLSINYSKSQIDIPSFDGGPEKELNSFAADKDLFKNFDYNCL